LSAAPWKESGQGSNSQHKISAIRMCYSFRKNFFQKYETWEWRFRIWGGAGIWRQNWNW